MKKVALIIPSRQLTRAINKKKFYRQRSSLPNLLDSISTLRRRNELEVISVLNSTETELQEYCASSEQIDKIIKLDDNYGVSRAWNLGANIADSEFLSFINDDVTLGSDSIDMLISCLENDPKIGNIGPAGSYWKNCEHSEFYEGKEMKETDVVSGYMFITPTNVFHSVGQFDVNYTPAGFEEIDYSYKIKAAGLKNVVLPECDVKHYEHHGVSAQVTKINYMKTSISTDELFNRNQAYFKSKWQA